MFKVVAFLKNESGATAIEYGLIAAGISIVIIGSVNAIGSNLSGKFGTISTQLKYPPACTICIGESRRKWRLIFCNMAR